jgi:membrane protein
MPRDMKPFRQRLGSSFPARCFSSFTGLGGLDRAMVIASQAFTTLIPLLIVSSRFLPIDDPEAVSDGMIRRLGLSGEAAAVVEQVFGSADPGSVGVLSIFLLVFSGVSFTRRMQWLYLRAWKVPTVRGIWGSTHAALGLLALLFEVVLLSELRGVIGMLPFGWALTVVVSAAASMVLWTSIPWLLLGCRTQWRRLLPGGVLTGTAVTLYGAATTFYMPKLIEAYSDRYGLFGVTVALISWLLCISVIVVAVTAVATELDRAPQGWARRLRAGLGIEAPQGRGVTDPQDPAD